MAQYNFKNRTPEEELPEAAVIFGAPATDATAAKPYSVAALRRRISGYSSLLDYIPQSYHATIASYAGTADLATYVQDAIDDAAAAGGGTILVPLGRIDHSGLDLRDKKSIIFQGASGLDPSLSGSSGCLLNFTGAAGTYRGIDMRQSKGCSFRDCHITYSSATFDGDLIDNSTPLDELNVGNSNGYHRCAVHQIVSASRTARSLLNLYHCVDIVVDGCYFARAVAGITGAPVGVATISNGGGSACTVTWPSHGLVVDEEISFELASGASLPSGVTAITAYYVKAVLSTDTVSIAASAGGAAITTSAASSGTIYCSTYAHVISAEHSESIAVTIRGRNEFVYLERDCIQNPGIGWEITDSTLEPGSSAQPGRIKTYGASLAIGVSVTHCTFSDSAYPGDFIDFRNVRSPVIRGNKFARNDGVSAVNGIRFRGFVDGGEVAINYFSFLATPIIYEGAITAHKCVCNHMATCDTTSISGMYFGDKECDFSCNYPSQITSVTGLANSNDRIVIYSATDQQYRYVPTAASLPRLATAPSGPTEGDSYYDTALHKVRTWDGSAWNNHW